MDEGIASMTGSGGSTGRDRRRASAWALSGAATALGAVAATAQYFFDTLLAPLVRVVERNPAAGSAVGYTAVTMAGAIRVTAVLAAVMAIGAILLSGRRGGARWLGILGLALAILAVFMQWRLEEYHRWT